jgi:hypothetical protein
LRVTMCGASGLAVVLTTSPLSLFR